MFNSKSFNMKKTFLSVAFTAIALTLTVTSCQKEDVMPQVTKSNEVVAFKENGDPQSPTGEVTYLRDNQELQTAINGSSYLEQIIAKGGKIEDAYVVHYGDPNKILIVFEENQPDSSKASGWSILLYNNQIMKTTSYLVKGSNYYFNKMGSSVLFSNMNVPFAGTVEIYDMDGNPLVAGEIDENGNCKPKWTHHGGYGSWSDCFEHYSSSTWGIIGYVFAPVPTLIGISVGCL